MTEASPLVRELVERHRGRTWVEEGSRGGARFVVELPCEAPRPVEQGVAELQPETASRF